MQERAEARDVLAAEHRAFRCRRRPRAAIAVSASRQVREQYQASSRPDAAARALARRPGTQRAQASRAQRIARSFRRAGACRPGPRRRREVLGQVEAQPHLAFRHLLGGGDLGDARPFSRRRLDPRQRRARRAAPGAGAPTARRVSSSAMALKPASLVSVRTTARRRDGRPSLRAGPRRPPCATGATAARPGRRTTGSARWRRRREARTGSCGGSLWLAACDGD